MPSTMYDIEILNSTSCIRDNESKKLSHIDTKQADELDVSVMAFHYPTQVSYLNAKSTPEYISEITIY